MEGTDEEHGRHHKQTVNNMDVFLEPTWIFSLRACVDPPYVPLCPTQFQSTKESHKTPTTMDLLNSTIPYWYSHQYVEELLLPVEQSY
jgi:hypothetical protein